MEKIKFGLIENIYSNPNYIREYALSLNYPILKNNASPGKTVYVDYNPISDSFKKINEYFNKKGINIIVTNHFFRISKENDLYNSYIHTDPANYQVLISLSPDHDENDLECYFEHTESGINKIDYLKMLYDDDYIEKVSYASKIVKKASLEGLEGVKIIEKCPIKYNNAVIINCEYFHAPTKTKFGKTNNTGRLIEVYAITETTLYKNLFYPYLWYYENVLENSDCEKLCTFIKENNISKILEYKSNIIKRLVHVYFKLIRNVAPKMNEFLRLKIKDEPLLLDNKSISPYINITINPFYLPQYSKIDWDFEMNNISGSFFFIIHLNNNDFGMTLYNHFKEETEIIPCKKRSIFIYPKSWLYPITQERIMKGDKYMIIGTITIID